jgi:RNA polymerase sigma-70 factor (ECF subfamily)
MEGLLAHPDDLLAAARTGDRDALAGFLRVNLPKVRRTLARYGGAGPDLDDLTQEALIAIAKGLPGFRGDASVDTWMHRICVRVVAARRPRGDVLSFVDDRHGGAAAPVDTVAIGRIAEAVDQLSPPRRAVFVLHDVEGYTGEEISEILDIPRGTVADRLRVAREQLQRLLRAWNLA